MIDTTLVNLEEGDAQCSGEYSKEVEIFNLLNTIPSHTGILEMYDIVKDNKYSYVVQEKFK